MSNTDPFKKLGKLTVALAVPLVFFLFGTGSYRSPGSGYPGGVSLGWFWCAFAALGLLALNIWGMKVLWRENWTRRLGLYISTGIVVGVLAMLIHIWQEQQQFDAWSHRGIRYFDPLD